MTKQYTLDFRYKQIGDLFAADGRADTRQLEARAG